VAVIEEPDAHKKEQTVNYELDRVIERLKTSKGQVRRVSAAVLLDHKPSKNTSDAQLAGRKVPFSPEELQQINNLVKDAIGYVKERGDTVSVANLQFSEEPAMETTVVTPDLVSQLARYGAIALAVLFAYFAVVRPLLKSVNKPAPLQEPTFNAQEEATQTTAAELMRKQMQEQQEAWELEQESLKAQQQREAMKSQQAAESAREMEIARKKKYDELVQYASQYAREHANDAALLLRAWLSEGPDAAPRGQGERT
jgi:flagellar M-ring protein FliF